MRKRKKYYLSLATSALALSVVTSGSLLAADLGGNCCSDLEERIADLEATAARKGNRKVSLQITGWVNEAVFFWDDGVERNAYVGTNSLEQSRVQFKGDAKISSDVSAGYRLELGTWGADSKLFSQDSGGDAAQRSITVRHSVWYLNSKTYGKLSIGRTGTATYHLLDDADATNTRNYSDYEAPAVYLGAFQVRSNGQFIDANGALAGTTVNSANIRWTQVLNGYNNSSPGQSGRRDVVKYDTPEIMGFVGTVAWGVDDLFDAALKYKNKFGDFSLLAQGGYGRSTSLSKIEAVSSSGSPIYNCGPTSALRDAYGSGNKDSCQWWGFGGTLKHEPTGLFAYGAYGAQQVDLVAPPGPSPAPGSVSYKPGSDITTTYYIQAGIEQKWCSLGKTTLYGEYRNDDVGQSSRGISSNVDFWSAGIVQNVDKAAMDLYLMYRHADGELTALNKTKYDLDALDMVIAGSRILF